MLSNNVILDRNCDSCTFWFEDEVTIAWRKKTLSSVHSVQSEAVRMVAARGQLYINARSPNAEPDSSSPKDSSAMRISQEPGRKKLQNKL